MPFAPEHLPAVGELFATTWERPRSAAYLRWRLLAWPGHHGMVALHPEGQCLAFISAARRTYRAPDGTHLPISETLDWIARPELQGAGVGVRVLQKLMAQCDAPLLTVGGTEATRTLVPRMGWQTIGDAPSFVLPLGPDALDTQWQQRKVPLPLAHLATRAASLAWFRRPPRPRVPRDGQVVAAPAGEAPEALYATCLATTPLPVAGRSAWLTSWSGSGTWRFTHFLRGGALVGTTTTRVHAEGGEADIVDIFAVESGLYDWLIAEAVAQLVPSKPRLIRTRASLPALQAALVRRRFLRGPALPVLCFAGSGRAPEGLLHITRASADELVLPYPSQNWPG